MKLGFLQLHITADIADNKSRLGRSALLTLPTVAQNSSYYRNCTIRFISVR